MNLELSLIKYIFQEEDVNFPEHLLSESRLELFRIVKKYYSKYEKLPSKNTLKKYIDDTDADEEIYTTYIDSTIAKLYDKEYLVDKLHDQYILRKVDSEAKKFATAVNTGKDIKKTLESFVTELLIVDDEDNVKKGYVWESAKERYDYYKKLENDEVEKFPSYHIKCLTKNLLGCKPKTTVCYVASPGVGKTTICLNVGYNIARFEGKDVMYISGELPKEELEVILDARDALVDSMLIRAGSLSDNLRQKYVDSLKEQWKRKDKFYIVEAQFEFTISNIISWIHQYKKQYGKYPDLLVIDYLWLMRDEDGATATDKQYGNLAKAIRHKIAKKFGICVHYSTQESRDGQKKKSDNKERGVESIADSNKIAPHVHAIIMLDDYKSADDLELKNKLKLNCIKNTLGPKFKEDVWYLKEYSYIGDSDLGLLDVSLFKMKDKEKKKVKESKVEKSEESDFEFENI